MDIFEIFQRFPTQAACIRYLERVRWGKNPICPYCGHNKSTKTLENFRHNCNKCHKTFSVTVGTIFHNTRTPLQKWFFAISLMMNARKGISSKQLQRNLDVSYKTAWRMSMQIRKAMHDDSKLLKGMVEMDETFIGGKLRKVPQPISNKKRRIYDQRIKELPENLKLETGKKKQKKNYPIGIIKRGRGTRKIPVVGMVERDGSVVATVMKKLSSKNLNDLVDKHVKKHKSVVITDDYKGYKNLNKVIDSIMIDHKTNYAYRGVHTNTIESFWAIIKRGIMGQYHRGSLKYLPLYISEFVYRYNNRDGEGVAVFQDTIKKASKRKKA